MSSLRATSIVTLLLTACGGSSQVIGDENSSLTAQGSQGSQNNEQTDCSSRDAEILAHEAEALELGDSLTVHAGTWIGSVQAYPFPEDDILLELEEDGTGMLRFGEAISVPEPTDPDRGYLCSAEDPEFAEIAGHCSSTLRVGLDYPIYRSEVEENHLVFSVGRRQPWDAWCQLQTPVQTDVECEFRFYRITEGMSREGLHECYARYDGELVPADCGWMILVEDDPCRCTSSACRASTDVLEFDLVLSENGDAMDGTTRALRGVLDGSPAKFTRQ